MHVVVNFSIRFLEINWLVLRSSCSSSGLVAEAAAIRFDACGTIVIKHETAYDAYVAYKAHCFVRLNLVENDPSVLRLHWRRRRMASKCQIKIVVNVMFYLFTHSERC